MWCSIYLWMWLTQSAKSRNLTNNPYCFCPTCVFNMCLCVGVNLRHSFVLCLFLLHFSCFVKSLHLYISVYVIINYYFMYWFSFAKALFVREFVLLRVIGCWWLMLMWCDFWLVASWSRFQWPYQGELGHLWVQTLSMSDLPDLVG
jgi:hypothetical protein